MFELLAAAKLFLTAPKTAVGVDRAVIEKRLGAPSGVGTDWMAGRGHDAADRVLTLDWKDVRVRLYESPSGEAARLIGVTVTNDALEIASSVHVGVDRGTVLRELGGPAFEDQDQIIYSLRQESGELPNDTVRLVFRDDRVIGIDWSYPLD